MSSPFLDERKLFFQQLSLLMSGGDFCIDVPSDYHSQVHFIKNEMLKDDRSGIVSTVVEFMITTATVDFNCHTGNSSLNKILDDWKDDINYELVEQIPSGIRALANQYFRERWTNSIAALNISWKEDEKTGLILPNKMWFVDGTQLYAEGEGRILGTYEYWIGKPNETSSKKLPLENTTILIRKNHCSWYDRYPVPYLVKRGTAYHWKVKKTLVEKQFDVLKSMLPYLLLARKGTEQMFLQGQDVSQGELEDLLTKLQQLRSDSKTKLGAKGLVGAFPFDTDIQHLLPDLQRVFNEQVVAPADRNLLASLGLIEIIEGISTSRRDAILNPKPLVEEIKAGVKDFQDILVDVLKQIKAKNIEQHPKYFTNAKMKVTASTIKAFVTNDMRVMIRSWYDRGLVSKPQALDATTDLEFSVQVEDRIEEENKNIDDIMLPPPIMWSPELNGVNDQPESTPETDNPETKTSQPNIKASIVKCETCDKSINYLDVPEAGMGYIECPDCGTPIDQEGNNYAGISDVVCSECDTMIDFEEHTELKDKRIIKCPHCESIVDVESQYARYHLKDKNKRKKKNRKKMMTYYRWAEEDEVLVDETVKEFADYDEAPFRININLPKTVRVGLPQGAQTLWRKTFNSVYNANPNMPKKDRELKAIRIAWFVVKKKYKKVGDKWIRRKSK